MSLVIREKVSLKQYTTLKVGGVADYLAIVTSEEELTSARQFAQHTGVPMLVMGGGSNILVSDDGYRGLVLVIAFKGREYKDISNTLCQVRLGAGEIFDDVVVETTERGLWGLENLSSIPGTVGATPVQNVGAYGIEVSSLIISLEAVHSETGEKKIFTNDECHFSYRDSFFKTVKGKSWIIIFVSVQLSKIPTPILDYSDLAFLRSVKTLTPAVIRGAVQVIRAEKFPDWTKVGTAGSFFKNSLITQTHYDELLLKYPDLPGYIQDDSQVKISLGWILDKICHLKGYCENNVCLFEKQALVLIANNGATATDIKNFVLQVQEKVFLKTNIHIEPEVLFI